jgi:hypothetical protein
MCSKSVRSTSAGEIANPQSVLVVFSEARIFCWSILLRGDSSAFLLAPVSERSLNRLLQSFGFLISSDLGHAYRFGTYFPAAHISCESSVALGDRTNRPKCARLCKRTHQTGPLKAGELSWRSSPSRYRGNGQAETSQEPLHSPPIGFPARRGTLPTSKRPFGPYLALLVLPSLLERFCSELRFGAVSGSSLTDLAEFRPSLPTQRPEYLS